MGQNKTGDKMDKKNIYDICIVGGGPAGFSAAVNAWVRRKKVLIFDGGSGLSKVNRSPRVENYLGFPGISGQALNEKFHRHIEEFKIPLISQKVFSIGTTERSFILQTKNSAYYGRSVIISTGVTVNKLLDGEEKFVGKGVSYCATCDGPLYGGKSVTVIDYTGEGAEETRFMSEFCKKVNYIGLSNIVPDLKQSNIEVILNEKPVEITGNTSVTNLRTDKTNRETEGIFIFRNTYPPGELVPGLEIDGGAIKVNRKMETNLRGIYAAGDCIGKPYQIAKSVGEGQTAALNAVIYLDS